MLRGYDCLLYEWSPSWAINVCTIKVNQPVGFARTLTIPGLAGLVGCSVTAEGAWIWDFDKRELDRDVG